jgi:hypothetical protein
VIATDDLEQLLRRVVREEVERALQPRGTLSPKRERLAALLPRLFPPCEQFTTAMLVEIARRPMGMQTRIDLGTVLRRDFDNDVVRVGIALRGIADSGTTVDDMRLVAIEADNGRAWELQPVEPR